MVIPPTSRLIGLNRPFWTLDELDCPQGRLLCAVCPEDPPESVLMALQPRELEYATTLDGDRRREWIAGRYCLAAALQAQGSTRAPLLAAENGAPSMPEGMVGSISHKGPLSVALANHACRGVGVDVEYAEEGDLRLHAKVLTAKEMRTFGTIVDAGAAVRFVSLHFSVKEAVYKSVESVVQSTLDFDAIHLNVDPQHLSREGEWLTTQARIDGVDDRVSVSVRFDGNWVLSTAKCY